MSPAPSIIWFRQDLRLEDNPALSAAVERGGGCIPVYIWDPDAEGIWPLGAASRWWLHCSLNSLEANLRQRASLLILRRGENATVLQALLRETGATAIYWNRRSEPAARDHEQRLNSIRTALTCVGGYLRWQVCRRNGFTNLGRRLALSCSKPWWC